jgi:hypothetical protein
LEATVAVKPRTCGHSFILTKTCAECRRYVVDAKAQANITIVVRPTHGTGH